MTDLSRRGALGLLGGLLAAPIIIRTPGLLMPVLPPWVEMVHWKLWSVDPLTRMATGGLESIRPQDPSLEDVGRWSRLGLSRVAITGDPILIRGGVSRNLGYVAKPPRTYKSLVEEGRLA